MVEKNEDLEYGQTTSRSEKILEAKSSFYANQTPGGKRGNNDNTQRRGGHPFGMIRMLMAGMLFLILVTAFHFKVSVGPFSRDNIERILSDDSHWQMLVDGATAVMKDIQPKD